jgi:ATP-dependent DNA helicase DinG
MEIDDVFGPSGLLSQRFDGYEPRAGQVALARGVAYAIWKGEHLFAEAPTGTGKSVGYLVPAILSGKRTIVVTANIALQEQLVNKDLPMLAELLPVEFTFALLKGVNNYLCPNKLTPDGQEGWFTGADDEKHAAIREWAETTTTGDVSDLPFQPSPDLWRDFSVSSDECLGRRCAFYEAGCFSRQARQRARKASVIVTNYHLFFAHLAILASSGVTAILPEADVVIMDEGHKAPDIARDFFGFRVTPWRVQRVVSRLRRMTGQKGAAEKLDRESKALFAWAEKHRASKQYRASLRAHDVIPAGDLVRTLKSAGNRLSVSEAPESKQASEEAFRLADEVEDVICREDPERPSFDRFVYYLEEHGKKRAVAICRKPIHAADALGENLFGNFRTVVVTSATLSTFGRFDFILDEFGAKNGAATLICDSPFNFPSQALIITPQMPPPQSAEYPDAVARMVWDAVRASDGRTLALFTSYRNLNRTYEYLVAQGCPYKILRQGGEESRGALIAEFKSDVHSVLLGSESFWAGVDIPGEALSCVVMDRLPFASPDDPVMDAISQRSDKWFFSHSMPRAIIAFKQGFGRLIRTRSDKGVCVVLDSRLTGKPYGANFMRSLPPCGTSERVEDARRFLLAS